MISLMKCILKTVLTLCYFLQSSHIKFIPEIKNSDFKLIILHVSLLYLPTLPISPISLDFFYPPSYRILALPLLLTNNSPHQHTQPQVSKIPDFSHPGRYVNCFTYKGIEFILKSRKVKMMNVDILWTKWIYRSYHKYQQVRSFDINEGEDDI